MRARNSLPQKKRKKVTQNEKSKFRASSTWQKFRKRMRNEQKRDYVTDRPLYSGFNLHHMDLSPEHYEDISDDSHFVCLNKQTHQMIHWLYRYYEKDSKVVQRLESVLQKMKEINTTTN